MVTLSEAKPLTNWKFVNEAKCGRVQQLSYFPEKPRIQLITSYLSNASVIRDNKLLHPAGDRINAPLGVNANK